jgi:hypothetical protein
LRSKIEQTSRSATQKPANIFPNLFLQQRWTESLLFFRSQGKLNKVGNHTCKYLPDPVLGTTMEQLSPFLQITGSIEQSRKSHLRSSGSCSCNNDDHQASLLSFRSQGAWKKNPESLLRSSGSCCIREVVVIFRQLCNHRERNQGGRTVELGFRLCTFFEYSEPTGYTIHTTLSPQMEGKKQNQRKRKTQVVSTFLRQDLNKQ